MIESTGFLGETQELKCEAKADVSWKFGGRTLSNVPSKHEITNVDGQSTLKVFNLANDNRGVYQCISGTSVIVEFDVKIYSKCENYFTTS